MATIDDILAEVSSLKGLTNDFDSKSAAANAASANVTDVTAAQNALVAKAQSDAASAISAAQTASDAAADAAVKAKGARDEAIVQIERDLESLRTPGVTSTPPA